MSKLLKIALGVVALSALVVGIAGAGLNPAATCAMRWLSGTNAPQAYTDEVSCTPTLGIMVNGITSLRGADAQVVAMGLCGFVPESWQWWASADGLTLGCANANGLAAFTRGFSCGAPPIQNAWTGVPGLADGQAGAEYYNAGPCLTPHGVALIWFVTAGSNGAAKNPANTYGLFKLLVDQSTGLCPGDCQSFQCGMCFNLNYRQPCTDPGNPRLGMIAVLDKNNNVDYAPLGNPPGIPQPPLYQGGLTWRAGSLSQLCVQVTPVNSSTWGKLKNAYR